MSQTYSHHDSTREKVGVTAFFVAALRAREHNKVEGRLFSDPYAQCLAGDHIEQTTNYMYPSTTGAALPQEAAFHKDTKEEVKVIPQGLIDGVSVRTKKIDEETEQYLRANPNAQVCVLGAGLDTRPWRIELGDGHGDASTIPYFEVDFPEIFDYKLPALSAAGAVSKFSYKSVVADLSLPGWTDKLLAAGYDTTRPTFWLLEGFTGYLTAEEFHAVFDTMTSLSARGSRLVATFLTPDTKVLTAMHRFTPAVPIEEVTRHAGWTGGQEDIRDIGRTYGRVWTDSSMNGYMIVTANYTP